MKNVHLIQTDKPSRLFYDISMDKLVLASTSEVSKWFENKNIYITNDEEIKKGDWVVEIITTSRNPYIGKTFYPKNDGTVTEEALRKYLLSVNYKDHYETIAHKGNCSKIILTTDQDLIKDGVQVIDDEFLEWFVNNPSCEEVEVKKICNNCGNINCIHAICKSQIAKTKGITYKIIIPKEEAKQRAENYMSLKGALEPKDVVLGYKTSLDAQMLDKIEPKQETLEEAAETELRKQNWDTTITLPFNGGFIEGFQQGAKWMQERSYSEEEVLNILGKYNNHIQENFDPSKTILPIREWFEQFKNKQNCLQIK